MLENIITSFKTDDLDTLIEIQPSTIPFTMNNTVSDMNALHLAVIFNAKNIFEYLVKNHPEMLEQKEVLKSAFCPILQKEFQLDELSMVIRGVDGMTYDRESLKKWLSIKNTMPLNPTTRCSADHLDTQVLALTPLDLIVIKNNQEFAQIVVSLNPSLAYKLAQSAIWFGNYEIAEQLISPTTYIPLTLYHANFIAESKYYMENQQEVSKSFASLMKIACRVLPVVELVSYVEHILTICVSKRSVNPTIAIGLLEMLARLLREASPATFCLRKLAVTIVVNTAIHHTYCQKPTPEVRQRYIQLIKDISGYFNINANRTIETTLHGILTAATYNPTQAPVTVVEAADLLTLTAKSMPNVFDFSSSRTHQIINMMIFLNIPSDVISMVSSLDGYIDIEELAPSREASGAPIREASGAHRTTHTQYCDYVGRESPKRHLSGESSVPSMEVPRTPKKQVRSESLTPPRAPKKHISNGLSRAGIGGKCLFNGPEL